MQFRLRPPKAVHLWLGGGILLWLLYALVFILTSRLGFVEVLLDAAANVIPLVAVATLTHLLLRQLIASASVLRQTVLHAVLAPLFALIWYAMVSVLLGFLEGMRGGSFEPIGFRGPAATWQLFQGLILYALVAAICYALRGGREAAQINIVSPNEASMQRYLLRDGEGLRPIEVARIVTVTGAQDYSEVATLDGRHLVRMSLGEFERMLDPAQFVRVHRSAIINLSQLHLAEPSGGGRMIAHMSDGQLIPVSRAGAASLREFVA